MSSEKAVPQASPSVWWSSSASLAQWPPVTDISLVSAMSAAPLRSFGAGDRRALVGAERVPRRRLPSIRCPRRFPESPERCCQAQDTVALAGRLEPVMAARQIVAVALELVEPFRVATDPTRFGSAASASPRKYSAWRPRSLEASSEDSMRSAAYSRIVSSIVNLGSSSVPSSRARPLSVKDASPSITSRSSAQTLCAASIVHPPAKTASRTNRFCSAGSRRS